jgi:hypothetical protein
MNQITITGNGAGYLLSEISRTIEGLFNRFHGKIGMTPVNDFKKCNLRVSGQVDILSSVNNL